MSAYKLTTSVYWYCHKVRRKAYILVLVPLAFFRPFGVHLNLTNRNSNEWGSWVHWAKHCSSIYMYMRMNTSQKYTLPNLSFPALLFRLLSGREVDFGTLQVPEYVCCPASSLKHVESGHCTGQVYRACAGKQIQSRVPRDHFSNLTAYKFEV